MPNLEKSRCFKLIVLARFRFLSVKSPPTEKVLSMLNAYDLHVPIVCYCKITAYNYFLKFLKYTSYYSYSVIIVISDYFKL